nr:type IV secretion system protein VirB4 [Chloroflexota bacterium]
MTDPDTGLFERAADDYLPYVGHVSACNVLCEDGSVATTFHVPGYPFELETHGERNTRRRQLNALWRSVADTNVTIAAHLVRHAGIRPAAPRTFRSVFAERLDAAYRRTVLDGRLMVNDWFLTVVVSPRVAGQSRLRRMFGRGREATANEAVVAQLDAVAYVVDRFVSPDGGRRLGYRREGPFLYSEFGEAMRLVLTARWFPVPLTSGPLGAAIGTHHAIVGPRGIEIREAGRAAYGTIHGLRVYPAKTVTGQLSRLCSASVARAPYALVLSQTFKPRSRSQSQTTMSLQSVRMLNAGDKARSEIAAIEDAQDDVASSRTVMGEHNLTLAVYADRLADLPAVSADAAHLFTAAGANSAQEERGAFAAYWSQLPGNPSYLRGREGLISSRNFAALASFDNHPAGAATGYWGAPLARFRTSGGTAYDYHPHVEEVGHTLILGRTGAGKTLLISLLIAMLEASLGTA